MLLQIHGRLDSIADEVDELASAQPPRSTGRRSPGVSPALSRSQRTPSVRHSPLLDDSIAVAPTLKAVPRALVAGQAALDASLTGTFHRDLAHAADEHADVCSQTAAMLLKQRKALNRLLAVTPPNFPAVADGLCAIEPGIEALLHSFKSLQIKAERVCKAGTEAEAAAVLALATAQGLLARLTAPAGSSEIPAAELDFARAVQGVGGARQVLDLINPSEDGIAAFLRGRSEGMQCRLYQDSRGNKLRSDICAQCLTAMRTAAQSLRTETSRARATSTLANFFSSMNLSLSIAGGTALLAAVCESEPGALTDWLAYGAWWTEA